MILFQRILYFGYRVFCFIFRPIRMGVRVMMIKDGQVLLVRQSYVPGWYMPGGGVKRGETLEGAARREAHEETGADLHDISLMGIYTNFTEWKTDHNVLFISHDFSLNGEHDSEILEVKFFPLDELPEGLWSGHRTRLEEYRAGIKVPQFGEW